MRKYLFFMLLAFPFIANAQDSLIIDGTVNKSMNGRILCLKPIYPQRTNLPNPEIYVESEIKDGKFAFNVPAKTLESYMISIKNDNDKNRYSIFLLLPKRTEIIFPDTLLKKHKVNGNDIHNEYSASIIPIENRQKFT